MPESVWFAFCLDKSTETIFVCSVDFSKEKAERKAMEEKPGLPILCIDLANEKNLRSAFSYWLADNGIVGAECAEAVRAIGQSLAKVMADLESKNTLA